MRAAAFLSAAALSAAVLTACNGGATEPPFLRETSPTPGAEATEAPEPTPEPTAPSAESGGLDGFREFAALIEDAVAIGDGSFLKGRALTLSVPFMVGDVVSTASPSEVRSRFEAFVWEAVAEESDEFGSGRATLYAVARTGESRYQAIVTAIESTLHRGIGVYGFTFRDDRWRLVGVSMDPGWSREVLLTGDCEECFDHWERWEGTP